MTLNTSFGVVYHACASARQYLSAHHIKGACLHPFQRHDGSQNLTMGHVSMTTPFQGCMPSLPNTSYNQFMYQTWNLYFHLCTSKIGKATLKEDKSSAVAEMGDRGHNRHGPKREGGAAVPLSRELGPRLVQCGLGRGLLPYQFSDSTPVRIFTFHTS